MNGFVALVAVVLTVWVLVRIVRYIRKERYFASEEFAAHKTEIASVVAEHNEVGQYTSEISAKGSFQIGASSTGVEAHLASFQNTSQWNYRRDRNVANYQARTCTTARFRSPAMPVRTRSSI